jgi:hypothetical protein
MHHFMKDAQLNKAHIISAAPSLINAVNNNPSK